MPRAFGGTRNAAQVTTTAAASGSISPAVTSANLLTGATAALTTAVGSWTGGTGTTVTAAVGTLLATTPLPTNAVVFSGSAPRTETPVTPGAVVDVSARVQATTVGRPAQVGVAFYDATGKQVTVVLGKLLTDGADPVVAGASALVPSAARLAALVAIWWGTEGGEVHGLSQPVLTETTGGAAPIAGPLRAQGNQILDATGHVVILRGIHREGLQKSRYTPMSQAEVNELHAWKANVVRIPLAENKLLPGDCAYDPSYVSQIDSVVQMVTGVGMVALLDLHANALSPCGPIAQQPMADTKAIAFWKTVAARYKSNVRVAFDLYNEPHDVSDDVWLSGGSATWNNAVYQVVGMQQLYDAVRGTGATNLVFVGGTNWASQFPTTGTRLRGTNIVWSAHAYTCPTATPAQGGSCNPGPGGPYDPSGLLGNFVPASATKPVMITEFGWPDKRDGTYARNVISYASSHGWGWAAFAWDGGTDGLFSLLADLTNYEPAVGGMPVLTGLAHN